MERPAKWARSQRLVGLIAVPDSDVPDRCADRRGSERTGACTAHNLGSVPVPPRIHDHERAYPVSRRATVSIRFTNPLQLQQPSPSQTSTLGSKPNAKFIGTMYRRERALERWTLWVIGTKTEVERQELSGTGNRRPRHIGQYAANS
jgi:hypothetical protein